MPVYGFKDSKDGYYQCEIEDGEPLPNWTDGLTLLSQSEIDLMSDQRVNPLVPESISTAQGHLALIEYGKYQSADEFINAIPDPVEKLKAEVNFYRRNDWERDNPTLLALAQGLGITDEELDQMFIFGSTQ